MERWSETFPRLLRNHVYISPISGMGLATTGRPQGLQISTGNSGDGDCGNLPRDNCTRLRPKISGRMHWIVAVCYVPEISSIWVAAFAQV
jgi:hypothetical protein